MTTYIKIPFASSGDKTNPPDTDAAGGVNWTQGYPVAYSKDPTTDPSAKRLEREMFNGILNRLSSAINEIQLNGVAPYITTADNGGAAFIYGKGAIVGYNGNTYISTAANNTAIPPASPWQLIDGDSFSGRLLNVKVISASGTYTPTAGTKSIIVEAIGSGGASGNLTATSAGQGAISAAGSNGAYAKVRFTSGFSSVTVTIGAGGTANGGGGGNGGDGNPTIFGALLTCPGGKGSRVGVANVPPFNNGGAGIAGSIATSGQIIEQDVGGYSLWPTYIALGNGSGFRNHIPSQLGVFGLGGDGKVADPNTATQGGSAGNGGLVIVWEYS